MTLARVRFTKHLYLTYSLLWEYLIWLLLILHLYKVFMKPALECGILFLLFNIGLTLDIIFLRGERYLLMKPIAYMVCLHHSHLFVLDIKIQSWFNSFDDVGTVVLGLNPWMLLAIVGLRWWPRYPNMNHVEVAQEKGDELYVVPRWAGFMRPNAGASL